ncbi:MAG TPA: hypothetical protein VFS20_14450 [Longimicrobium sp.]|nr:hypothetical protein [Longimicrobium sp.]
MGEQVRAALRAACLSSDRPAFLQDPKGRPMLRAVYYDGRYDRGEVSAVAAKVEPCVRHLHASTLWDRLAAVPPESVVLVEAHDFVEWEGVRVYAGPGAPLDPYQVAREVSNADLRLIIKRFTGECSGAGSGWRNWRFGLTPSVRDSSPRLTRAICRHSELRIERTVSASVWCNGSSLPQRE